MIRFSDVSYTCPGGTAALKNVNLHIARGERLAIVGSNGSGKTTLALLINGILCANSGRVEIDGLDPSGDSGSALLKRKVGLVFQNPDNQLVSTTVEREIAFSLENVNTPVPEMKMRVEQAMELFGLSSFRNRLNSDMSGGEKQRLALASVMVAEPEILILDEPGSYLDESGKRLLDDAVSRLLEENKELTVLRITQYSNIAAKYDRMIVFRDGRIVADGNPEDVFSSENAYEKTGIEIPLKYRIKKSLHRGAGISKKTIDENQRRGDARSIILESISFGYNNSPDEYLFNDLNLKIKNDKVYGLVGQSGSGKTTLIQLMAGLLKHARGKISYDGFQAKPGRVAVSFQQSERQFFLDTVDKEIKFGAENLGLPDIDGIAEDCYRLIGLDRGRYAGRNPFTLSGGEKRRVAFGAILSLEPSFTFFDEPTCALDYNGINKFKELVIQLKSKGVGVVIISHYGNIIFELADEVIVLCDGSIESVNSKKEFFNEVDSSEYLSASELAAFQLERFGDIRYFSERELFKNI